MAAHGAESPAGATFELTTIGAGVSLGLALPPSAIASGAAPLDLSSAPGAELALHQAWQLSDAGALELACVHAPASRWIPGLEDAVLGAASAMVRSHAGWGSLSPGEVRPVGTHLEQSFSLPADGPAAAATGTGRHLLGFAGQPPQVILCSLVCTSSTAAMAADCASVVGSVTSQGLGPAPPPGLLASALGFAARSPELTLGAAGLCALAAVALLLRLRPRPQY